MKSEVEKQLARGENVILDVDVKGGISIKQVYKDNALTVFVQPPSIECLRRRLIKRGTDSIETINNRIQKAEYEITFAHQFDKIIINDILEEAQKDALTTVREFIDQK